MRNIKLRETKKDIKVKDTHGNLSHYIKIATVPAKEKVFEKDSNTEHQSAQTQAVNKVSSTGKTTMIQAGIQTKHLTQKSYQKIKTSTKKDKINRTKETRDTIKSSNKPTLFKKKHDTKGQTTQSKDTQIHRTIRSKKHLAYQMSMKKLSIRKQTQKINQVKTSSNVIHKVSIGTVYVVKKMIPTTGKLYALGVSAILVVVMTLFTGTFSVLAQTSTNRPRVEPLSAEVLAYRSNIEKYAKKYDMEEYIQIIMAVMMQESGGKGTDPMQCSECPYNTKYPNTPNAITDPQYSIEIGIKYLSGCFKEAKVKGATDIDNISLALQGYNYGNGYISWAVTNFGGYTKANAQVFSDIKKAELGTSGYGDPDYVDHVLRYVSFGFGDFRENPDFTNDAAWGYNNPYTRNGLCGQCTWFVWGRMYEIYGWAPEWTANGSDWVTYLTTYNKDKFRKSDIPVPGAIFSGVGKNHVGIIIAVDGNNVTVQEGNLDGITNSCSAAQSDWWTKTYTLQGLRNAYNGVEFAVEN